MLTQEKLKEMLSYCPITGQFKWKKKIGKRITVGNIAGCSNQDGYIQISIEKKIYAGHRLAWFYTHGEWPKQQVDHIDGNRSNNAIANLRDVSSSDNRCNQARHRAGNLPGVSWHKLHCKWMARTRTTNGVRKHLGWFITQEEAEQAVLEASLKQVELQA
jgi:hypothetical protein